MSQINIGVIGTGAMGQRHCRVYSNLRHVRFQGVYDVNPEVGQGVAVHYGVSSYDSVDDLLDHVDAVSLAVPTPFHFDLAMRCLARGIHVLIEKPIAETLQQARMLAKAARETGLVVQVGHIERFNPAYTELRLVLENMDLLAVDFRRLSAYQGSNTDVDVVLDLMIHDLDLACDLVRAEPKSVDGYGLSAFSGSLDHVVAHLNLEAGPLLTMTASRTTEQKIRAIDVTAREAFVEADLLDKNIQVHRRTTAEYLSNNHRGVKYRQESLVEFIHVPTFEPLFLELRHFIECILEGKPSLVPPEDGLRALRLALAVQEATQGHLVDAVRKPGLDRQDRRVPALGLVHN